MCDKCGPVPPRPSKAEVLRRLYVDRDPVSDLEDTMLGIYDRTPDLQAYIADLLVELEAAENDRMTRPSTPAA